LKCEERNKSYKLQVTSYRIRRSLSACDRKKGVKRIPWLQIVKPRKQQKQQKNGGKNWGGQTR
jgi:hypothetical protein